MLQVEKPRSNKAKINFTRDVFAGVKQLLLKINYTRDIGYAFIDGELIHDNFCNGMPWIIGLSPLETAILKKGIEIYISPLKKGAYIRNYTTMAARVEVMEAEIAAFEAIEAVPIREVVLS